VPLVLQQVMLQVPSVGTLIVEAFHKPVPVDNYKPEPYKMAVVVAVTAVIEPVQGFVNIQVRLLADC
jgi:hypothetical protein